MSQNPVVMALAHGSGQMDGAHCVASKRCRADRRRGFTLIELMIVVAVVAVLAAIAIPSYNDSVRKGRRGQAKTDLLESAQLMERYRTVNGTYAGATAATLGVATQSPRTGATFYYTINLAGTTRTAFTLTATPTAATRQNLDTCGTLTLNAAGVKLHSTGTDAQCGFGTVGP